MSQIPAVGDTLSPAGKPMNCSSWGTFEAINTSPTDGFCHGGTVDGDLWAPCPSQAECRAERNRRHLAGPRANISGVGSAVRSTVREVGQQRPQSLQQYQPQQYQPQQNYSPYAAPSSIQQRTAPAGSAVIAPNYQNQYLDTSRVGAGFGLSDHHAPVFLPEPEEPIIRRLGANMVSGGLQALGYQFSKFFQHVDPFPYKGPKK